MIAPCLTLSGGLEVERLEPTGEGRGVNDVHTVIAVVFSVKHDGCDKNRNGNDACSEA